MSAFSSGITPAYAGKSGCVLFLRTEPEDHPRVCGEKNALPAAFVVGEGSPPRMRGKEMLTTPSSVAMRITPAYAGKRAPFQKMSTASRDHPRVCGEKTHGTRGLARPSGSPPRMRGKVRLTNPTNCPEGITPAYAGKSGTPPGTQPVGGDHPRVCGEKPQRKRSPSRFWGSPPRMRGKVAVCIAANASPGITPAYAGKSCVLRLKLLVLRDHPRVCGEKHPQTMTTRQSLGSPPRMRGKGSPPRYSGIWTGITPAYAGKSLFQPTVFLRARDHPRVCGEKLTPRRSGSLNLGSPPRMRGKVIRCSICQRGSGITPAYAGKRHLVMDTSPLCRDHPRVCGEKFTKPVCKTLAEGSPPRMRGKACKEIAPL